MANLTGTFPATRCDEDDLAKYRETLRAEGTKQTDDLRSYIKRRVDRGARKKPQKTDE